MATEKADPTDPTATETRADERIALLGVVVFLALLGGATAFWGLPGLAMVMLATVPVVFVVLVLISVGK